MIPVPDLVRAVFFALIASACTADTASAAPVTGIVVDAATGRPVADAIVTSAHTVVHTGEDGRFALAEAASTVAARAPGYRRALARAGDAHPVKLELAPVRPHAVYLSVFGITNESLRNAALKVTGDAAVNAFVIDMKGDRGMTPYPSAARAAIGADAHLAARSPATDGFQAIVDDLHARHLYLIARIVVFKDDPLAQAHPEWAVHDADGRIWHDREGLRWVDPFSRAVWHHNLDVAEEAARAGFDEIQFDYVRFPDESGLRFGLPNTRTNRTAAIVGFLEAARERLAPYNVFVAADIFGYVCWNLDDTAIGQQLETLGGPLDYISPMLYPSGFTWGLPGCTNPVADPGQIVRRSLAEAKARTGLPGVRFRPWLQAFRDYAFDKREFDADDIRAQTDAADAAGTDGWMLWNPRNRYDADQLPR